MHQPNTQRDNENRRVSCDNSNGKIEPGNLWMLQKPNNGNRISNRTFRLYPSTITTEDLINYDNEYNERQNKLRERSNISNNDADMQLIQDHNNLSKSPKKFNNSQK